MSKRVIRSKGKIAAALAFALGAMNGCSLGSSGTNSSIYVDLSSLEGHGSRFALLNSPNSLVGLTATAPTTASGFACYGVNVTGPGIADSSPNPDSDPMRNFYATLNLPGTYCSYRGVVTPPLYLNSAGGTVATLQVPPGGVRLIQVVGVNDQSVCASGVLDDPPGSTGGSRFYEIGRAVLNDVFGDRSVDVNMNWPTTATDQAARLMDCGGNCSLVDSFNPNVNSSAPFSGSITMYAQRIPFALGKYIRSVDVNLKLTAADTVTAAIYSSAHAATKPEMSTGYSASLTLPAGTSGPVGFDLRTNNLYLRMDDANYDYWIVIASTSSTTSWKYTSGSGSPMAQYASGWIALPGAGFDFRVNECAN